MKPLSEIMNNVHNAATPGGGGRRLVRTTSCPSAISQVLSSDSQITLPPRPKTAQMDPPSMPMPKEQSSTIEPPASSDLPLKPEDGAGPLNDCRTRNRKRSCSEDDEEQSVDGEHKITETNAADPPSVGRPQKRAKDVAVEVKPKQRSAASANDPPPVQPVEKSEASTKANTTKRSRKRPASTGGETTTTRPVKKSSKQQSSAIQAWKRNAINGRHRNLLSSFVTYEDQLPPTPTTTSYEKVSVQSPSSRGGDRQSLPRSTTDESLLDMNDGVPMCTLDSDTVVRSRSSSQLESKSTRSNYAKLTIVLRSFFIICSSLSFTCRCLIWFGGKSSESIEAIIHNMMDYSSVWMMRLYLSIFHLGLIFIELGWTLPVFLPSKTLSVLTQRGFVQSFLATLDLVLQSNNSMAEAISIVSGALLTARERRVHISHAIMSVTSRGMMFVGAIYFFLGLLFDESGGKKKRRSV